MQLIYFLVNANHGDGECSLNGFIWSIFGKPPFSNTSSNSKLRRLLLDLIPSY